MKSWITAVFICSKIRVIIVAQAGSAGLFARPILIQTESAVIIKILDSTNRSFWKNVWRFESRLALKSHKISRSKCKIHLIQKNQSVNTFYWIDIQSLEIRIPE